MLIFKKHYCIFVVQIYKKNIMKLFNELRLKFEKPDWSSNPEFGLIDTILESHPFLYKILKDDVCRGTKESIFGRKDTPSVEQIVRAAIYKEMKKLDYRELEYAQKDSRICVTFIKLDERKPFSFQMFQQYISKISEQSLTRLLVEINKIAIGEGLEDVKKIRMDSTVVKTNIHYPTNNSLVWDCIKESHRLLSHLSEEIKDLSIRDYRGSAKKNYYKINITKSKDKRQKLFIQQLILFTKSINQVDQVLRNSQKKNYSISAKSIELSLGKLLPLMRQVYDFTRRKQVLGESVPSDEKIFSIYELHTDIIVKGGREVLFGHKINLAGGKSNLILDCQTLEGNPSDTQLYQGTLDRIEKNYKVIPHDVTTDGGFASNGNKEHAQNKGIVNIVFNKVVGSMQNIATSKKMETMLKKWRSGMEAVISNYKRRFKMFVCNWKGEMHFKAKVLWSAIAYNIRVMTAQVISNFSTV